MSENSTNTVVDTWARPVGRGEIDSILTVKANVIKDSEWSRDGRVVTRPGDIFRHVDKDLSRMGEFEKTSKN